MEDDPLVAMNGLRVETENKPCFRMDRPKWKVLQRLENLPNTTHKSPPYFEAAPVRREQVSSGLQKLRPLLVMHRSANPTYISIRASFQGIEFTHTVDGRNPFCTTWTPWWKPSSLAFTDETIRNQGFLGGATWTLSLSTVCSDIHFSLHRAP